MLRLWSVVTMILAALSLAPSFAHLLEAPPGLKLWPQQLWSDTTVHHAQFALFKAIGAPVDVLAIAAAGGMAWLLRGEVGFRWALAGALLFAAALVCWFALVAPANSVLATWQGSATLADLVTVRDQWESGHIVSAVLKLLGLAALAVAVTSLPRRV